MGDLVGASNIFNFVYNTLQLNTLDPTNDVGLAQMVMGSQTKGVTPMALAAAFQIFYDGEYTTPHLYTRVLDRDGNIYLENNATSYQALTPDTAYVMNRLLKNVLFSSVGTASGRYPNSNGMEAFGKTGTASDEKDLWFVGGTQAWWSAATAPRADCWPVQAARALPWATTVPMTCPIPAPIPMPHRRLLPLPRTQTMLCPPNRSYPPIPVHWTRNKDKNRTFSPLC